MTIVCSSKPLCMKYSALITKIDRLGFFETICICFMRGGGGEVGGVKYEPKTKARLIDELTPVVD